ncbi:BCCT family transporter [Natronococcus jeotgali]|uniref:Compatible solute transporter (Substrate choline/ glycine betaine) n=1 Tax=Natronococcus jeotgali DSM 18795 TaxID=1227498 RepID=L9XJP3_9EURY|nr:BCCT family transporter [Natronococcus jeotgali]ELY61979.1 compatible solute transporter (substrate choline/ glycine betaine) [Natronococcus jeotgali DSM 18795]
MVDEDTSAFRVFVEEIDPIPFILGTSLTLAFIALAALRTEWIQTQVDTAFQVFGEGLAWLYLGSVFLITMVGIWLMCSKYGKIKLGDGDPDYSYFSYFAMFFSAGLSAGIVFFGPVEALTHYAAPSPLFEGVEAETDAAIVPAIAYAIFHYGISAWAGYLAIGIPVAYYVYREGAPFRTSTVLYPIVGKDGLDGVVGKTIDTLAVVATLGGIATGLGFIATQLLAGIEFQTGATFGNVETLIIIVGITIVFVASLLVGVDRGIRRLSDFNLGIMGILLVVALVLGPTLGVLNTGVAAVGTYVNNFFSMMLFSGSGTEGGTAWASFWTVFYWSWWLAWAPFVGLFLARISEGRTIREVIFTAYVAMTSVSIVWFSVVGGTSVLLEHGGAANLLSPIGEYGDGVAGFILFGALPLGEIWIGLFFILVVTFFATSADSSTLAVAMLTTGGKARPSRINRLFWGVLQGIIASILVVLGGAAALRSSVIITGVPFAVICLLSIFVFISHLGDRHGSSLFQEDANWVRQPSRSEETSASQEPAADD